VSKIVSMTRRSAPPSISAAADVAVVRHQSVEVDVAKTGVVHVRGDARGAVGGTQHPGDEARSVGVPCGPLVGDPAREPRGLAVELRDQLLHRVVRHRDAGSVEGIGLDDVRPGREILAMDGGNHVRSCQHQQVVVALEIPHPVGEARTPVIAFLQPVGLDHRAHRAVQDQDALGQGLLDLLSSFHYREPVSANHTKYHRPGIGPRGHTRLEPLPVPGRRRASELPQTKA
jgi:hypothetical protein